MITLTRGFDYNQKNDLDDTAKIKFALTNLGYYDDTEDGLSAYPNDRLLHSIKNFQKDNNLKIDGVIKPDGPTINSISQKIEGDKTTQTSIDIFSKRRQDMMEANTIGADKYFHCLANYESTEIGLGGEIDAHAFSAGREIFGVLIKGDPISDVKEDLKANKHGREAAKSKKYQSAREACSIFRPEGLDDKY